MALSSKYIRTNIGYQVSILTLQANCKHKWTGNIVGYICTKCDYRTRDNKELNSIIQSELKEQEK